MISYTEAPDKPRRRAERILQLRLAVEDTHPRVWRRMLVKESMWLTRLHEAVQVLFDWYDYQLHRFVAGDMRYGNPVQRADFPVEDDRDFKLEDLALKEKDSLFYEYDFAEGWRVEIRVEKILPAAPDARYPCCIAGEMAGPPEDCGGAEAFKELLYALKHPHLDASREWIQWLGDKWKPAACDLEAINRALRKLPR